MVKNYFRVKSVFRRSLTSVAFIPLWLFIVSVLVYGLLIPWLHLYIDDWIWFWTWEKYGRPGLVRYFSTNRPFWGIIFQVTLPFLTQSILSCHIFALLVRWLSSLAFWWLVRLIWPNRGRAALYGALVFLIYPGFVLQPIALTYSHIFLIYIIFQLSLCFNLLAQKDPGHGRLYTGAAILLSIINLLTVEFFFTLELARPFVLFFASGEKEQGIIKRITRALRSWIPYLGIFLIVTTWRTFFFKYQTYYHSMSFMDQMNTQPVAASYQLLLTMIADIFTTTVGGWLQAVERLASMNLRLNNSIATVLLSFAMAIGILLFLRFGPTRDLCSPVDRSLSFQIGGLGLIFLIAAGWPFWLTELDVQPVQFNSRFTIPFILGAALVIVSLLELLHSHRLRNGIFALLVAISCGYHFQIANDFRLDWLRNQQLMWQIAWRIPALQYGTTLLITDFPITYYNIAALSTELNALYPGTKHLPDLAYYMLYSREVDRDLPGGLAGGKLIRGNNVTAKFLGSTSQVLAVQYDSGRCLRLLDPAFDVFDETLPAHLRKAAQISDRGWIRPGQPTNIPPRNLFGSEPPKQWCYYFEKAELARDTKDWDTAAQLGEEARSKNLKPKDEMEKLVFIEAYAHTGKWDLAIEMTRGFQNDEKVPMLCRTWQWIIADLRTAEERIKAKELLSLTGRCQ